MCYARYILTNLSVITKYFNYEVDEFCVYFKCLSRFNYLTRNFCEGYCSKLSKYEVFNLVYCSAFSYELFTSYYCYNVVPKSAPGSLDPCTVTRPPHLGS